MAEIVSVALLAAVLTAAVMRPHGIPEALVAVPAAAALLLFDVVSLDDLESELDRLVPVLVFLAAVLALAHLCAEEGVFATAGHWLSRSSGGGGQRLLLSVFGLSVATTSVLSLDATVVLLTPVVHDAATRVRLPARPHVYAAGHLANSASLLLPMANLTSLLAISATGFTMVEFAGLMALPLLVVLAIEYVVLRGYFRSDLRSPGSTDVDPLGRAIPWFGFAVVGATLGGFVVSSFVGIEPYWVALCGAGVLAAYSLANRRVRPLGIARSIDVPFLLFVVGLAVVVRAVVDHGLGGWVGDTAPDSTGLAALLGFAVLAAALANTVNNLPAVLILLGPAAAAGPLAVLATLIGVNVGPNLSYAGSLATLLWRRVLSERGLTPSLRQFTVLGVLTAPAAIVGATVALWCAARVLPYGL
jgi:arsenical pump membrane protein